MYAVLGGVSAVWVSQVVPSVVGSNVQVGLVSSVGRTGGRLVRGLSVDDLVGPSGTGGGLPMGGDW